MLALTPLLEAELRLRVSDIKLLELANLNHPALKELIVQAPGHLPPQHHRREPGGGGGRGDRRATRCSARTCAYYHDIGKGKNPLYFGENQKGENRHDSLAPGDERGDHQAPRHRRARAGPAATSCPRAVADVIPQHHGTRLVGYFFHKAVQGGEGREGRRWRTRVYRYPGPKPQFREAALVMIADAVEAASRAMPEPDHANGSRRWCSRSST